MQQSPLTLATLPGPGTAPFLSGGSAGTGRLQRGPGDHCEMLARSHDRGTSASAPPLQAGPGRGPCGSRPWLAVPAWGALSLSPSLAPAPRTLPPSFRLSYRGGRAAFGRVRPGPARPTGRPGEAPPAGRVPPGGHQCQEPPAQRDPCSAFRFWPECWGVGGRRDRPLWSTLCCVERGRALVHLRGTS